MENCYVWYVCLVFWLPDDSLVIAFLISLMKPSRRCLWCLQMMGRAIMLLVLAGVHEQGRIQTPPPQAQEPEAPSAPRLLKVPSCDV